MDSRQQEIKFKQSKDFLNYYTWITFTLYLLFFNLRIFAILLSQA